MGFKRVNKHRNAGKLELPRPCSTGRLARIQELEPKTPYAQTLHQNFEKTFETSAQHRKVRDNGFEGFACLELSVLRGVLPTWDCVTMSLDMVRAALKGAVPASPQAPPPQSLPILFAESAL